MGWGGCPDAGQAATRRGGKTSGGGTGELVQRAAALSVPNNTQGAGGRREGPKKVSRAEPVNKSRAWTEEELQTNNHHLQQLTGADRKLMLTYGDTIHQNYGTQLDGDITDNAYWQSLYRRITSVMLPLYELPSGAIDNGFILIQTQLLRNVR